MKQIIESLRENGYFFKNIESIDLKKINIKNKIIVYKATSIDGEYISLFHISKKSRFIKKDSSRLLEINDLLKIHYDHNFMKTILSISSPLCSKAKKVLESEKWQIIRMEN